MHAIDAAPRPELVRPKRGLHCFMTERHQALEAEYRQLLEAAPDDDPGVRATRWREFVAALRDHMAAEDELILPAYQQIDRDEAAELGNEHARIAALLDEVGADLQREDLQAESTRRLLRLLGAHARREAASMYRWAERSLPLAVRRAWLVRIGDWLCHPRARRIELLTPELA